MTILFLWGLYISSSIKEDKISAVDYNKLGSSLEENLFSLEDNDQILNLVTYFEHLIQASWYLETEFLATPRNLDHLIQQSHRQSVLWFHTVSMRLLRTSQQPTTAMSQLLPPSRVQVLLPPQGLGGQVVSREQTSY